MRETGRDWPVRRRVGRGSWVERGSVSPGEESHRVMEFAGEEEEEKNRRRCRKACGKSLSKSALKSGIKR